MKFSSSSYANVFMDSVAAHSGEKAEKALSKFIGAIKANGDWSKRAVIAAAAESAWRIAHNRPLLVVESARPLKKSQMEKITRGIEGRADVEEKLNPELVAGVRLILNNEKQLDLSLAHLLKTLFT